VLLLIRFLTRRERGGDARLGLSFAVVATALAATHHYAIFFLGGELAALMLLRPRPLSRWLPASAAAAAAGGVGLLAALFLAQQEGGESYQLGLLAVPGAVWSMLSGYALLPSSEELHAEGWRAALRFLPFALAAAPAVLFLGWKGLLSIPRRARLMFGFVLAVSVSAPFLVAWLLGVGVNPRYLIAATPLLIVVLASATAKHPSFLRSSAAAVLVSVMAVGCALHLASPGHGREDVAAAARWLESNVPADETLLVTSEEMEILARFHWPERRWRLYPPRRAVVGHDDAAQVAEEMPFEAERAIYVIGREWLSDPDAALRNALKERYDVCSGTSVRGIQILCLSQRDDGAAHRRTTRRAGMKGGPS